ncbi:MAG TPA: tetratricopeptide repeat protein [Gemmatimonadales bacterium]|nr:tetratricopeptide repeat protein [Gemmatimonadales bacterium]
MTDDIRSLTARLADEPGSLAFLELAEALRRRGQLEAAYKVARGGLSRYPGLADAHDLMARVLSDQGDLAGAFDAWSSALQLDPMRTSALKGIAFLYFRAGDPDAALDHLQRAMEVDPDDPTIRQAIGRIGPGRPAPAAAQPTAAAAVPVEPAPEPPSRTSHLFDGVEGGERGLLLVDANGLRLGGELSSADGADAGDRVAAQLAGVSREAARATRLLGLGNWHAIAIECPDGHLVLAQSTADTVLLASREPSVPIGRVGLLAERAARAARTWLEGQS